MFRAFRSVLLLVVLLASCPPARAEEPPPDPSQGERYDGRPQATSTSDRLLFAPRIILKPLALLWNGLAVPLRGLVSWNERNNVVGTVLAAFSSRDGQIGVRPAFQYTISFTPVLGLRFFDHKLFGPNTNFEASVMLGNIDTILAGVALRPTPPDRALEVGVALNYNRRNDQFFTGINFATDPYSDWVRPARYAVEQIDAVGVATWTAVPGIFVDMTTGFGIRRFAPGRNIGGDPPIDEVFCLRTVGGRCVPGTVDEVQVPGFAKGTQFFRGGVALRIDGRDNSYRPGSGALLELGGDWTHGVGSDTSQYLRGRAAMSAVLDLWRRSRTLVLRVEADALEPIGATPVPFSELITLGGPDSFRGFRWGRFRNFSSLFAGVEYRWPVWMWMDAAIFTEYGGTFGQLFEGFALSRMRPDVGLGLRLRSSDAFYVRGHVAYGWGDGWQVSLSLNVGL